MSNHKCTARHATISAFMIASIMSSDAIAQADNTAEIITQAQRNTAMIRAKIEETKALNELDLLRTPKPDPAAQKSLQADDQRPTTQQAANTNKEDAPEPLPGLLAIYGRDNILAASLRMPNNLTQDVRVGDDIEGGFIVKSISSNRVVLQKKGKDYPLRIFSAATPQAAPQGSGAQVIRPNSQGPGMTSSIGGPMPGGPIGR